MRKRRPSPGVATWFRTVDGADLHLSVLVVGEIRQGVERLRRRDPGQADVFERWLEVLRSDFAGRVLPVSAEVAEAWGRLNARGPLPVVDGLLAATAMVHRLTLVTRDTGALAGTRVALLDPFG